MCVNERIREIAFSLNNVYSVFFFQCSLKDYKTVQSKIEIKTVYNRYLLYFSVDTPNLNFIVFINTSLCTSTSCEKFSGKFQCHYC